MVESRCAIAITVRPAASVSSASWICFSDSESSAEVASSRRRIGAFFSKRARDRQPLLLAAGKQTTFVADDRLVTLRLRHDEIVRESGPRRRVNFFLRSHRAVRTGCCLKMVS